MIISLFSPFQSLVSHLVFEYPQLRSEKRASNTLLESNYDDPNNLWSFWRAGFDRRPPETFKQLDILEGPGPYNPRGGLLELCQTQFIIVTLSCCLLFANNNTVVPLHIVRIDLVSVFVPLSLTAAPFAACIVPYDDLEFVKLSWPRSSWSTVSWVYWSVTQSRVYLNFHPVNISRIPRFWHIFIW